MDLGRSGVHDVDHDLVAARAAEAVVGNDGNDVTPEWKRHGGLRAGDLPERPTPLEVDGVAVGITREAAVELQRRSMMAIAFDRPVAAGTRHRAPVDDPVAVVLDVVVVEPDVAAGGISGTQPAVRISVHRHREHEAVIAELLEAGAAPLVPLTLSCGDAPGVAQPVIPL